MRLVLYGKFLDAFTQLPKQVQNKTIDFIKKFREYQTSSAINYEKIHSFKDQQLRTVRIDQKYRAIIRQPETGDLYHLLWVDNHDEAMDWAKNKVFEWNSLTQSYQVYEYSEEPIEETISKKDSDEGTFMEQFKDKHLLKLGIPEMLLPSIKKIDNIEDLEKIQKYIPEQAFENLFYLLDGVELTELLNSVEEGLTKEEEAEQSANNKRNFVHITNDEELQEILNSDFKKWKVFLHPSQRNIVNRDFNGSVKLTGAAGTGKTVVAMHRAKYLTQKQEVNGDKPVLFTTFTKALMENLKQDIDQLQIDNTKIHLINIHGFIWERIKKLNLLPKGFRVLDYLSEEDQLMYWEEVTEREVSPFSPEFLSEEYRDVILYNNVKSKDEYIKTSRVGRNKRLGMKDRKKVWDLVEKYEQLKHKNNLYELDELSNILSDYYKKQDSKPFSYVICDEVQDFSNVNLRLLRNLVEQKQNDLFLVGDPLQNIYNKKINFSKIGINVKGRRSRKLKLNYRTTEQIRKLAFKTVKNIEFDDFEGGRENTAGYLSLLNGKEPTYNLYKSLNEEMNEVLKYIEEKVEEGFNLNDICIAGRTNKQVKEIKNILHREDFSYYHNKGSGFGDKEEGLWLSTFHNMKGLEFKVVILVQVDNKTVPYLPHDYSTWDSKRQEQYLQQERSLIYVAMTRAIEELMITGTGEKSELVETMMVKK